MEIKTSEFFKNLKYLPAPGTDDFFQLIEWEKQKCLGGVTIQGVFIPGWLYWHLNHWWIGIDEEDEYGNETIVPKLPELRDNEWERAEAIEACKNSKKGYIEIGQRRGGKALLNSSPLYTPQGEIPIGQAKVGMKIYDPQGELTTIKEVYPQGLRPIYRVHLQDGRDIFADENHLWKVYNKDTQNWKVLSTKYLLDKGLRRPRIHTGYKDGMIHLTEESKFALPNSKCVPYEEKDVRIDPYWLGLWLADGNSRSTAITNIDKEVIDYIYQYADKLGMRVSIDHQKDRSADSFFIISGVGKRNYLLTALREYNLLENKHIPHLYLHSSEKQRRKLLAGLLDGDGTATKNGSISFSNSNKKLIDDVVFLVRSLGMRCRVSSKIPTFTYKGEKKKGKVAYKVKIYSREKLFGLTRKNDRVAKNKRLSNDDKTFINSIDFAGWGEATCIVVDNEDKLFLTEGFTPTHNSEALTSFLAYNSILFENSQNAIITGNSNDQAVIIQKFDFGHKKLWDGLYIPKLDKDWRRSSVRLGYKDVSNEDHVHSLIAVRNANNGNNTEVAAGLTLKTFILDEALHEDTPIHYQGYTKPLKDVQVGDMIYGPDGDLSEVGDKINPGVVETLKISLSDGREIVASPNHLWKVYNTTLGKYEVITTEDINNKYFYTKYDSRYDKYYKSYIYSLPNIEPLNFPNERITIDPYWLGCWLADGTKKSTMITTPDEEIVEYCQNYADNLDLDCTVTHLNNARRVSIVNHSRKGNSLLSSLREYNLIDNKHIPIEYLYNSTTVRMQLLRGLMDSDGSCDKNGKIEFTTSSFKLAEDIKFLIRGLGINVHITQRQGKYKNKGGEYIKTKTSYRFSIFTDKRIFNLPRKASNMSLFPNKKQKAYRERTTIVGISPNGPAQVYCLKMKNSSGMFLAGDLIPTHNCGKWNFGEVLAAAKPALLSPKGWRGIVLLTGTGGSFTHGEDCERYFNNPESNKFMGFKDEETGKITGKFMSGLYRMDCKVDSTLADYLQDKRGVELDPKQYKKLSKIPMKVSDKELARRKIEEDRALKAKDPNRVEYLKEVMYYPLTPDECFMTEGVNIFNEIAIKQQQEFLYASGKYLGDKCILSEELNGEIHCEIVRDDSIAPISTFPLNDNESKEGCIIIYEHPPKNPPYGLYVSAIDPLKHDKSSGDSLQSIYVFKRMNDVSSEEYQDMIVAQYTGRMETLEQTCEICRLLIKYYNALTFVENEDIYFIKYMQAKMEDHYLVDEQPFIKNLHPSSNVERGKGFHATPKIVAYLNSCLKSYSEEVIAKDRNEEGEVIKKILGVSKILDPMLLEEMRKFRVDSGNYDRIRAASAAIALARHMDPFYKVSSPSGETTNKSKKKKRRRRDLLSRKLSGGSSLVRNTKPSLRN